MLTPLGLGDVVAMSFADGPAARPGLSAKLMVVLDLIRAQGSRRAKRPA